MVPWGISSHLYKGLATLVIALIALQYLFGSVLETRHSDPIIPSNSPPINSFVKTPRYYHGSSLTFEKNENSSISNGSTGKNFTNSSSIIASSISTPIVNASNIEEMGKNDVHDSNFIYTTITSNDATMSNVTTPKVITKCPIVPPNLVGPISVNIDQVPSINELEKRFSWLEPGGHYAPQECLAQNVIAVIIPYRDRAEHLLLFLAHMHPFLKKQQLNYQIYVVEQDGNGPFNRAMLMNVGFTEALKHHKIDCFIFHDVDLLPEDDRNLYNCPEQPRHMSVAVNVFRYRLPYNSIFGGVCALTRDQFRKLNGFSNLFWGWGGEDDDMSNRITHHNYHISRYPINIARYKMLSHYKEKANPKRYETLIEGKKRYNTDGLNSLKYTLKQVKFNLLYTWVLVELHPPS